MGMNVKRWAGVMMMGVMLGCEQSPPLVEPVRHMMCTDLRDGEKWEFFSDHAKAEITLQGVLFTVVDTEGHIRTFLREQEVMIKCVERKGGEECWA